MIKFEIVRVGWYGTQFCTDCGRDLTQRAMYSGDDGKTKLCYECWRKYKKQNGKAKGSSK